MTWIDFRKVYNMVPCSWMIASLELVGAAKNIVNLLKETMKKLENILKPFVPNAPFLYPLKRLENLTGIEKGCIGNE